MLMIYLHTKGHVPNFNGSAVIHHQTEK